MTKTTPTDRARQTKKTPEAIAAEQDREAMLDNMADTQADADRSQPPIDFDAAGEDFYGKEEYARMVAEEENHRQKEGQLDAYLLNQGWWSQRTVKRLRVYHSDRIDALIERGLLRERAGNVLTLTQAGSEHYDELPAFFTVDTSRGVNKLYVEIYAKGRNLSWITVTKYSDVDEHGGRPADAQINWSAIGAATRTETRTFMSMLVEASNLAGRWDDEAPQAEVAS